MGKHTYPCSMCGRDGPFSGNQKRMGPTRRCTVCVGNPYNTFSCQTCGRKFQSRNDLEQHQQTHIARQYACPGCGKMYRGMTDTTKHFESGACEACKGPQNARKALYNLVSSQPGGRNFLANDPGMLRLTHNGELSSGGGYTEQGNLYKCPACGKGFYNLSGMMAHQQARPQCRDGQNFNLRLGHNGGQQQQMRFFHGSSWDNAWRIKADGFIPSESGCLGRGIYVAREDKARRFAERRARETGAGVGGLVHLLVTVSNPKYVMNNDYHWQSEGYDACRAERTTASTNMEWCIRDASQVQVIRVEEVYV